MVHFSAYFEGTRCSLFIRLNPRAAGGFFFCSRGTPLRLDFNVAPMLSAPWHSQYTSAGNNERLIYTARDDDAPRLGFVRLCFVNLQPTLRHEVLKLAGQALESIYTGCTTK